MNVSSVYAPQYPIENGTKKNLLETVEHGICSIAKNVFERMRLLLVGSGQIRTDANAFGRVVQLVVHLFSLAEIALMKPGSYAHISSRLGVTKNIIDAVQTLEGIRYFGSKSSEKTAVKSLGNAAMFVASVGLGMEVLDKCKLLNLGRIAEKIGSVPVLGAATRLGVSFGQVCCGFAAFGYIFFAVDAIERLIEAKDGNEKRRAWIDLAWLVAEIAATCFLIFASSCMVGVIGFGITACVLGTVSYLRRMQFEKMQQHCAEK